MIPVIADAANVTMTGSDVTSQNTSYNGNSQSDWPNSTDPSSGNAYFTGSNTIRDPQDLSAAANTSFTFAGDSLTISNGGRFLLKYQPGAGNLTQTLTTNLILSGGVVDYAPNSASAGDTVALAGTISLTAGTTSSLSSNVNYGGLVLAVPATISGSGNVQISDAANGNVNNVTIFSASNTFTGSTTVIQNTLRLSNTLALQDSELILSGGVISFDSTLASQSFTIAGLGGSGNIALQNNAGGAVTVTLANIPAATADNYSGVLSGAGALVVNSANTGAAQVLSGSNTFSGGVTLSAGQLNINNGGNSTASALGTGTFTIAGSGVSIDNTSSGTVTVGTNNPQTWNADFTFVGTGSLNLGNGAVTLGGNRNVTVNANTLTVGGAIGDGGNAYQLTKSGNSTLILSGSNSFTGGIVLNQGILVAASNYAFGTTNTVNQANPGVAGQGGRLDGVQLTGNITLPSGVNFSVSNDGTGGILYALDSTGNNTVLGTLSMINGGGNSVFESDSGTLTLTSIVSGTGTRIAILSGAGNGAVTGLIGDGGGTAGVLVQPASSSTWTFSGSNTYTGMTTVSSGTLRINNTSGSGTGHSAVAVMGGTLGGNGTIGTSRTADGAITVSAGARIAAGASTSAIGTLKSLSTSGITLNGGSGYTWKINNPGIPAGSTTGGSGTPGNTWDDIAMAALTVSSAGGANASITIAPTGTISTQAAQYSWIIAQSTASPVLPGSPAFGTNLLSYVPSGGGTTPLFALDTSGLTVNTVTHPLTGFGLEFENIGGTNDLVLDYNAAPEPGTALLVLGGAVPTLVGRRRRTLAVRP
jgi:fibronectin-binding autotransporter adhesin